MKKKTQALELVKEEVARGAVAGASAAHEEVKRSEALMYLGGIGAIKSLTDKLSAQAVRALEAFGESKAYELLGFKTFADFLNESPYSPLTKNQYYDRLNALEAEGDAAYDLLNNLGVPISKRKLLTDGAVQLEGDTLVIGEERVPLNNRRRVVEAIRTLAEETARQAKKIEKGQEQNKKLKQERDELKKRGGVGVISDYNAALLQLVGAFDALRRELESLDDEQRGAVQDHTLRTVAEQRLMLEESFGFEPPAHNNGHGGVSDDDVDAIGELM